MGQAGELRFHKTGPGEPVKISEEERKLWHGECFFVKFLSTPHPLGRT